MTSSFHTGYLCAQRGEKFPLLAVHLPVARIALRNFSSPNDNFLFIASSSNINFIAACISFFIFPLSKFFLQAFFIDTFHLSVPQYSRHVDWQVVADVLI